MGTKPPSKRKARPEALHREPWRNTKPPGNAAIDHKDLERGIHRLESLVGR